MDENVKKPIEEGRDAKGRFLKGFKGGPGRPAKHPYYQLCWDRLVGKKEFEQVFYAFLRNCMKGDVVAQKYFLDRCLGKLKDIMEIIRPEEPLIDVATNEDALRVLAERIGQRTAEDSVDPSDTLS